MITPPPDVRYFYLRDRDRHPVGVCALRLDGDNGVRVAASLCARSDQWTRHGGVVRALGRLGSRHYYVSGDTTRLHYPELGDLLTKLGLPWKRRGVMIAAAAVLFENNILSLRKRAGLAGWPS